MIKFSIANAFLILFSVAILSCNSPDKIDLAAKQATNVLCLLPNGYKKFETRELIDISNINRGGYVLVISDGSAKNKNNFNTIRHQFLKNQVFAVHSLELSRSKLLDTDKIAIENASIICFIGDFGRGIWHMSRRSEFRYWLNKAYDNGTIIIMYGGSRLYSGVSFEKKNKKGETRMAKGLDLINYKLEVSDDKPIFNSDNYNLSDTLYINNKEALLILDRTKVMDFSMLR